MVTWQNFIKKWIYLLGSKTSAYSSIQIQILCKVIIK